MSVVATRHDELRGGTRETAAGALSRLWILAAVLGVVVVAAIAATKSGALATLPAKVILGITIPLLFGTSLAAIARDTPRGRQALAHLRAPVEEDPAEEDGLFRALESEQVQAWRHRRLASLGVAQETAVVLAADTRVSVHDLERLLRSGCPLGTALRILQPV